MPTLTVTKTYDDGAVLSEADLDGIKNSLETFFNTTKIDSDNIQTGGVSSAALATNSVIEAKILNSAVTADKIAADAVTTVKILDANVTTAKIADANVTTVKIADGNVTQAKRVALGQQISAAGSISTSSSTFQDGTTVTITTTGRPVFVGLVPDAPNGGVGAVGNTNTALEFRILRDGATVVFFQRILHTVTSGSSNFLTNGQGFGIDVVGAGTYTYKVQARDQLGVGTVQLNNYKLCAFEL